VRPEAWLDRLIEAELADRQVRSLRYQIMIELAMKAQYVAADALRRVSDRGFAGLLEQDPRARSRKVHWPMPSIRESARRP
jgi:hypothetical protein